MALKLLVLPGSTERHAQSEVSKWRTRWRPCTKGINDKWTGRKGKYEVHTIAYAHDLIPNGGLIDFKYNTINLFGGSGVSNVVGGNYGTWYTGKSDVDIGWMAAHEAGHLMGLGDRYQEASINGKRITLYVEDGWKGKHGEKNIMAEIGGKVWEKNIKEIIKNNKCGCQQR